VEVPVVAEGGAMVPRSSVAEVVMAVDVAVAAMAHGRGRGWGGAELCGRGGAVGGGGAGNLRSAGDARQPHGHERGRKGAAGRASGRVWIEPSQADACQAAHPVLRRGKSDVWD